MTPAAPAPEAAPQGDQGARPVGSGQAYSSTMLATLYRPVIAILTADRGEQINRCAAMWLEITEARDAEELAKKGDFTLAPDHPGAQALTTKYQPLIALLMATRDRQMMAIKQMQQQIRDARDIENMEVQGTGQRVQGRPAPLMSRGVAKKLAPQGGVTAFPGLAAPEPGPARDRVGAQA